MSGIDDIIHTIVSIEQRAIWTLLNEGIPFSRIKLYRQIEDFSQGILVDGVKVFSITFNYSQPEPIVVFIVGKFHPPFDYLN